jgi:Mrp family chromosome partitioning ATPase/tetratricopeptide (TPR) repeat protein
LAATRDGYLAVFASARSDAGRAMALANVAALLAQRGDKVLVVDLAVDSPTLSRYFPDATKRRATSNAANRSRIPSGVVDLLSLVREGARRMPAGRNAQRTAGMGLAHDLVERVFEVSDAATRIVKVRYPGLPEERAVELHYMPVGGEDAPHERAHPFESLDLFPGVLEEMASTLRSRYDAVLIDAPTGEADTTAILISHLADKLVFLVDDASLEEAIELASWAHGRRSLAATDRALNMFPLMMHVADGAAGKAFLDEAKPRLEAFFRSTLGHSATDLSLYVELAQIPQRALRAQSSRLAVEVEPTSNAQAASHAYFRFVQCLSKSSPMRVGARARPMSAEVMSAIEARRTPSQATDLGTSRSSASPPAMTPPTPSVVAASPSQPGRTPIIRDEPGRNRFEPQPFGKLPTKQTDRLAEAMSLRAHGRNAEAAKICAAIVREAVRDDRGSKEAAKALLALGDLATQSETGEYDEIVHRFHERRHDDPEMFECVLQAHYRRGKRHAARERFALATDSLMAAVEMVREWKFASAPSIDLRALAADAALSLAVISMERGDDARALHALGRALEGSASNGSLEQREIEAAAASLEILVLARSARPDHAAERAAALRERLSAAAVPSLDVITAITACNEGAALALSGRYNDALVLLGALRERLEGTASSPYYEIAAVTAHNEAMVLGRLGRTTEALERIVATRMHAMAIGATAHRVRFASALLEAWLASSLGRNDDALDALEKLQTVLRWEEVCLDHPGDGYMRERRTDVSWYLTIARDMARGVDELPSLLQAAEEDGEARHGRVHVRAAFELAQHGRRLDDLGAHPAATACYEEAMLRLEKAAMRAPGGDAALLACAGLVAISRGATPRGIPLLRKAAEQGGTAAIQAALEMVHHEGFDVEAMVIAVREAFDWVPRERMDTLRLADGLGVTLIRALVFPGKPPEPMLPPMTYPNSAGRFAVATTLPISGREGDIKVGSAVSAITRLLVLEPPDESTAKLANAARSLTGRTSLPPLTSMNSWPQRLGAFGGTAEEIALALDHLFPKPSPVAVVVERRLGTDAREVRFAIEIEPREGPSFRLAVLHDVHGNERHVFDGITLSHYRDGQDPTISRRGSTMLLALWRALAQGLWAAFDLSLRAQPGLPGHIVVLAGGSREPGTGVMTLELEIDRILLTRGDPRALRQVNLEDVDGTKHRFSVQASVGKTELSLFRGARSG